MGGRGASSGAGGAGGGGGSPLPPPQPQQQPTQTPLSTLRGLVSQFRKNKSNIQPQTQPKQGGYTDDNNPNLIKYQQQTPDKLATFLGGTERHVNLNDPQYQDGYSYHDLPLNRLLARLGINKGPGAVMDQSEFDAYLKQTGQTVMYRGWSSTSSAERFMNTKNNHVGNGRYGDGYYFSPSLRTASSFAGPGGNNIMPVALSPKAHVIDYPTLRSMMQNEPAVLQHALYKCGHGGSGRTFGSNSGEAQYALMKGYNVIDYGNYKYAVTNDALVVCRNLRSK